MSGDGRRLLNIANDVWAEHFDFSAEDLLPKHGDRNAEYTAEAYDVNDPRKQVLRRNRVEALSWAVGVLARSADLIARLNEAAAADLASGDPGTIAHGRETLELARLLNADARHACSTVARWLAVPEDAPAGCRCGTTDLTLPVELAGHLLDITC
jgi:hypothetical protein